MQIIKATIKFVNKKVMQAGKIEFIWYGQPAVSVWDEALAAVRIYVNGRGTPWSTAFAYQ